MKQEEKTKQSIELIINAAIPEFVTKGYEDAVINDICRNNGISKGKLFHHFNGKDALYLACCRYVAELFAEHCSKFSPNAEKTYQENLHDYFIYRNRFFMRKSGSVDLLWAVTKNEIPKFKSEISEIYAECKATNIRVLNNVFDVSQDSPKYLSSETIVRVFYVAQSYTLMNFILGNSIYSLSESAQRKFYNENVIIMDSVMDTLLFGIYPRDEPCPKRMDIDIKKAEEILGSLQI